MSLFTTSTVHNHVHIVNGYSRTGKRNLSARSAQGHTKYRSETSGRNSVKSLSSQSSKLNSFPTRKCAGAFTSPRNQKSGTRRLVKLRSQVEEVVETSTEKDVVVGSSWPFSSDCAIAYLALFGVLGLGSLDFVQELKFAYVPYFVTLATTTIYIGAHRALSVKQEEISLNQGLLAPVITSVALFGVYTIIKLFPDLDLKTLLGWYFWLLGSIAVSSNLRLPIRFWGDKLGVDWRVNITLPEWLGAVDLQTRENVTEAEVSVWDGVALALGVWLATLDNMAGHNNFTINNILAACIVIDILQLVGLQSFVAASALSVGLLVYDVFWVFGSSSVFGDNVMMKVATSDSFTGPFRFIFPRWESVVQPLASSSFPFSLLGLGDIAVPGLLLCLLLKLDTQKDSGLDARAAAAGEAFSAAFAAAKESPDFENSKVALDAADAAEEAYMASFDDMDDQEYLQYREYFIATLGAYVAGLSLAFGINFFTNAGQPALLYLVPCTLGMALLVSIQRAEPIRLLTFVDKTKDRDSFVSF